MTKRDEALASMKQAQALLEVIGTDLARLAEMTEWLDEARARVQQLTDYINGPVGDDLAAVTADDPAAITPPVANEDAAWEALAEFDLAMMRLLRIVTAHLTTSVDGLTC